VQIHRKEYLFVSNVQIEIFNIARTVIDREEVRRWLDHVGASNYEIPEDGAVSNPALLIALAAKRCYMSFEPGLNPNVTKVRSDMVAYIDNILSSGHGSVLEHSVYTFALEGVSRVFTAEMNRHRAGWAISEGSLRFIRFDKDIPWWLPTSLQPDENDDPDLADRKHRSREVFERAFRNQEAEYAELLNIWEMESGHHNFSYKKKVTSCLRRIVGLGVATGGVWSGNMRALRHVIAMRAADAAEEEIFHVFSRIGKIMIEKEPLLFGDISESKTGALSPKYWKV
jgi:thymidylate synthase (FAD)